MKLIPFNLFAAENPVRAIVWPDGRLAKFMLWVERAPGIVELCELHTNN